MLGRIALTDLLSNMSPTRSPRCLGLGVLGMQKLQGHCAACFSVLHITLRVVLTCSLQPTRICTVLQLSYVYMNRQTATRGQQQ